MFRLFIKLVLSLFGWHANPVFPKEAVKCVLIAAPHTSNWDTFYMRMGMWVLGIPLKFTVKDDWTKFPLGIFMKPIGALGIDRSTKKGVMARASYVDQMAEIVKSHDKIAMVVAAEGSRSLRKRWKMGFYHTAMKAGAPLCFGYLDYKKKEAGIGGVIYPTGDIAADMKEIHAFYKNITPKFADKWSLDERYI